MATTVNGTSELRALADVLKSNIDQLLETIESRGQVYPSLNEPWTPESEAPRTAPDVLALGDIIVSAAAQLIATVRPTPTTPLITALQVSDTYGHVYSVDSIVFVVPSLFMLASSHPHACSRDSEGSWSRGASARKVDYMLSL